MVTRLCFVADTGLVTCAAALAIRQAEAEALIAGAMKLDANRSFVKNEE
jgi:hypothetical protein